MDPYFYLFYKIIVSFFSFFCQDANKARSNCAIIGCSLSRKHKLTLYKTQNREPIYVRISFSLIFARSYLYQKLGDRHPNSIELASWLVHVLCDFKATWHPEALVFLEYTMKIYLADIFYPFGESPPWCIFPL